MPSSKKKTTKPQWTVVQAKYEATAAQHGDTRLVLEVSKASAAADEWLWAVMLGLGVGSHKVASGEAGTEDKAKKAAGEAAVAWVEGLRG